ncbi:hypothetical protein EV368DRAFT_70315 [Lentinula lateritia]|nr:hypothetical protein EV368DRAFT_70315 [Lentinula lateritia]
MSFCLFLGGYCAVANVAFLLGHLAEGLMRDQESTELSGISYCTSADCCFGYMTFLSVYPAWYNRASTTPFFEPFDGAVDTYITTWPLLQDRLSTNAIVSTTIADVKITLKVKTGGHCGNYRIVTNNRMKKRKIVLQELRVLGDSGDGLSKVFFVGKESDRGGVAALSHLCAFDQLIVKYGPSLGMTRKFRWDCAKNLGLSPPEEVLGLLLQLEGINYHPWMYSGLTLLLCSKESV